MLYDIMYNLYEEAQICEVKRYPVISKQNQLCDDIFIKSFRCRYGSRMRTTRPAVGPLNAFPLFCFWGAEFKYVSADAVFAVTLQKTVDNAHNP